MTGVFVHGLEVVYYSFAQPQGASKIGLIVCISPDGAVIGTEHFKMVHW